MDNLKLEDQLIFSYLLSLDLWFRKAFHHAFIFSSHPYVKLFSTDKRSGGIINNNNNDDNSNSRIRSRYAVLVVSQMTLLQEATLSSRERKFQVFVKVLSACWDFCSITGCTRSA